MGSHSHVTCRYCAYFEQAVPWHSDNYRVYIHSETRVWHDKNTQSIKCVIFLWAALKAVS